MEKMSPVMQTWVPCGSPSVCDTGPGRAAPIRSPESGRYKGTHLKVQYMQSRPTIVVSSPRVQVKVRTYCVYSTLPTSDRPYHVAWRPLENHKTSTAREQVLGTMSQPRCRQATLRSAGITLAKQVTRCHRRRRSSVPGRAVFVAGNMLTSYHSGQV